ncbi:hypothetical protein [Pedobacter puniceum]|uniref:DUF4421 domain-containing protein n=1 Tax=Pedobacter puniceum TaxID=2666136 RepID=A0A7K0FPH0_9SPHI|nr:hypothetical protein [Pedobacter puniceum]MRX47856.1 hypothetical protein [Pedobacter puniceum]
MSIKKYLIVSVLILSSLSGFAQQLETNFNFHGFADNREYAKSGRLSQTIFGARFSPEIGALLDSTHRLRIGVNLLHEFGSSQFIEKVNPVIYYQYQKKAWDFYLGAFPRVNLLDDYPRILLNDTLNYFRPNIEGMLVKYETAKFKQNIWIDWTSKQTNQNREAFLFGFSGKYQPGKFFISHYAYMFHNAFSKMPPANQYLQDNGAVLVQLGLDLGKPLFLDSLTISAGAMASIERTRGLTGIEIPKGFISNVYLAYKKFDIQNTFYAGQGHCLINGDKFYTSDVYDRLDIGFTPIMFKNIQGKFICSLHFVDGVIDSQQAFSLRYNLFNSKALKK